MQERGPVRDVLKRIPISFQNRAYLAREDPERYERFASQETLPKQVAALDDIARADGPDGHPIGDEGFLMRSDYLSRWDDVFDRICTVLKRRLVATASHLVKQGKAKAAQRLFQETFERLNQAVPEDSYFIPGLMASIDEASREGEKLWRKDERTPETPPITGYDAPEYAKKARDILQEQPSISSFSKLSPQMGTSGESKVDTIKEGIGYKDLPREEKTFGAFKKLLFEKVRLMEKGEAT